jgi:hypothetical protein
MSRVTGAEKRNASQAETRRRWAGDAIAGGVSVANSCSRLRACQASHANCAECADHENHADSANYGGCAACAVQAGEPV